MNLNTANLAFKIIFSNYDEINKQIYRWGLVHSQYREKNHSNMNLLSFKNKNETK